MWIARHGILQSGQMKYTPPLDIYTGAAAAYSVRKLRTAYTGSAIRVRRSTDNVEQDIGFDGAGNLNISFLTSFIGSNSGFITIWYDQSGNAKNQVQTTTTAQPRIINNGVIELRANLPFIYYHNAGQNTSASSFSITQPLQVFLVAQNTRALSFFPYYFDFTTNRAVLYYQNDTIPNGLSVFNGSQINSGNTSTLLQIISVLYNSTSSNIFINGSSAATGDVGTNGASGNFVLGSRNNNTSYLIGGFSEVILYPSNQSSNRAGIEANMNNYYKLY